MTIESIILLRILLKERNQYEKNSFFPLSGSYGLLDVRFLYG